MKVTVFVPIDMEIEGKDLESEVKYQLEVMSDIINASELESEPFISIESLGVSEIIKL